MTKNHFNLDVTDAVAEYFLCVMQDFYADPKNEDVDILMYWEDCKIKCMKGWKKIMKQKHAYDFNKHLSLCTDISLRNIERISLKN